MVLKSVEDIQRLNFQGKGVENLAQKSGKFAFEKITDEKWYAEIGLKKA